MSFSCDREFRNNFPVTGSSFSDNPSNFAKMPTGKYGNHIELFPDGKIVIDSAAYSDDVVAFVLGAIGKHPGIENNIKEKLGEVIDLMDARAVKAHGYNGPGSANERAHVWESVAAQF